MASTISGGLIELRNKLEAQAFNEVRKLAVHSYGLRLTRDSTKEDVINMIIGLAQKADYAVIAEGDLLPGWARIKIHPVPGKPTFPFYVNCNGYTCWLPFGQVIDVPRKLINLLNNAEEFTVKSTPDGQEQREFELSYPFTIIQDIPGPDPRPGLEVVREKTLAPKRAFEKKYGYWPTDKVLKEYRASLRGVVQEDAE